MIVPFRRLIPGGESMRCFCAKCQPGRPCPDAGRQQESLKIILFFAINPVNVFAETGPGPRCRKNQTNPRPAVFLAKPSDRRFSKTVIEDGQARPADLAPSPEPVLVRWRAGEIDGRAGG
jgi:hypothetical protein